MTTVAQIFDAFQDVNRSVRGIKAAPTSTQVPTQLTAGQLPAAITWYAGDDWTKFGNQYFVVEVYVAPVGQANPTLAMKQCLDLADAFRTTYRALHNVAGIPIARTAGMGKASFGSEGVHRTLGYAGVQYFGFSFRVPLMGSDE